MLSVLKRLVLSGAKAAGYEIRRIRTPADMQQPSMSIAPLETREAANSAVRAAEPATSSVGPLQGLDKDLLVNDIVTHVGIGRRGIVAAISPGGDVIVDFASISGLPALTRTITADEFRKSSPGLLAITYVGSDGNYFDRPRPKQ